MSASLTRAWARVRALFQRRDLDLDLDAELRHHLEALTEDNVRAGMSPAEARRQAHLALGGMEQARELHREVRGVLWLEQLGRDLVHGFRLCRRERGFTLVALSTVAIGIGLNATVYSLVNTVLLRPLPFTAADRLTIIHAAEPHQVGSKNLSALSMTVSTWEALQETTQALEQIEAYDPFSVRHTFRLTGAGREPETVLAVQVTPGLFPMLGIAPARGRLLRPEDATVDAPPRMLLTHELWQRRYRGDPAVVGQTIQINHQAVEVIGVLPPQDTFARVFFPAVRVDGYVPVVKERSRDWGNTLALIGRTRPALTTGEVAADLQRCIELLRQRDPSRNRFAYPLPLQEWVTGSLRQPLLFLWAAAGLVLTIVAFNLGGLLLARGTHRSRELAVRAALGADRGRLARQLLTESGLLVAGGTVAGATMAWGLLRYLRTRTAVEIPLLQSLELDATAIGFTMILCLGTLLVCGLAPAWRLSRAGLQQELKVAGRSASGSRQRTRGRSVLVVLQIALACTLAFAGSLMVRSLLKLLETDIGFNARGLLAVRIDPVIADDPEAGVGIYLSSLLDRVRALPGVTAAGVTDCIPVERDRSWGLYPINHDNADDQRWTGAHVRIVSPGLIEAMGTPLLEGRDFTPHDQRDTPVVLIINRTLANQFWPDESALGRQFMIGGRTPATVIGVVADVRHAGPDRPSGNEFYLTMHQQGSTSWDLMVRTSLAAPALTASLRTALREFDPSLPFTRVRPMQDVMDRSVSSRRLLAHLVAAFAGIALALAALGLYGLVSYAVAQRTQEIGIRLALGAEPAALRRRIIGDTLVLTGIGLLIAGFATLGLGRLIRSLLHGVSPGDGPTYLVMIGSAVGLSVLAAYLPARRASRIDPMIALRAD